MDPINTAKVASTAINVVEASIKVYGFVKKALNVHITMSLLLKELEQVADVCRKVKDQVERLSDSHEHLLLEIDKHLSDCETFIEEIGYRVSSAAVKTNVLKRMFHQASYELDLEAIENKRMCIDKSLANLALTLQLASLQNDYLVRQNQDALMQVVDETIVPLLTAIYRNIEGPKIDQALRNCARRYTSAGESMSGSIAGTSIAGPQSMYRDEAMLGWLRQGQAMRGEAEVIETENLHAPDIQDNELDEWEDDIEIAENCLDMGKAAFFGGSYKTAEMHLVETMRRVGLLPAPRRQVFDINDIQLSLAVCTFYLHDTTVAEKALRSTERSSKNLRLAFEAEQCLVIVYMRMNKHDLAIKTGEHLLRQQRRTSKDDDLRHKTLALLAYAYDAVNNLSSGEAYRGKIAVAFREKVCQEVKMAIVGTNIEKILPAYEELQEGGLEPSCTHT